MARMFEGIEFPASLLDRLTESIASEQPPAFPWPASQPSSGTPAHGRTPEPTSSERPVREPREAILRDLTWLLNTTCLGESRDLSRWRNVQRSVLNFGIPELSGRTLSGVDCAQIERRIKKVIETFEPRLQRGTIVVEAVIDRAAFHPRALQLSVQAQCIESLHNEWIHLTLHVDLETGRVRDTLL